MTIQTRRFSEPLIEDEPVDLVDLRRQIHQAAYPTCDAPRLHALEDQAATLLGVRTARQAPEVVTACELYRRLTARINADAAAHAYGQNQNNEGSFR